MFYLHHVADLPAVAQKIITFAENLPKIWLFNGEMGAGKTTLIKAIGYQMGIVDHIQSPTYSLVNEYLSPQAGKIYHFDLYRLNHETEALDFGIEEYFDSGHYCWIEWATQIPTLLPTHCLHIDITVENDSRTINLWHT